MGKSKSLKRTSTASVQNGNDDETLIVLTDTEDNSRYAKKSKPSEDVASSSANMMGFEGDVNNVVAVMEHCKLKLRDGKQPKFVEHVFKSKKKIFSFNSDATPDITFVNSNQQPSDDDYDYCLAVYNRTEKTMQFAPTDVLHFEGHYKIDPRVLEGKSLKKKVNFNADYSLDREAMRERRKELTAQFGSVKKNKMLEAAVRRNINEDTLTNLSTSTFESKNAVAKTDTKIANLSDLNGPVSVVLPQPNNNADCPEKIYPLTLFYNEHLLDQEAETAVKFIDHLKLSEIAIPSMLSDTISPRIKKATKVEKVLLYKLILMSRLVEGIFKSNNRGLKLSFDEVNPVAGIDASQFIRLLAEFFSNSMNKDRNYKFTAQERDKLVSHFICLLLIMNNFTLPVSPISNEFGIPERMVSKTLTSLGCNLTAASAFEVEKYDTSKIAHLKEPPSKKKNFRNRK